MTGSSDSQAISLAVSGALNALKACSKAGIKRFVYTSSSFAVTQPKPNQVFEIAENTFNEEAVEKVRKGTANGEDVYCASKVEAERALRSWGKEHAPEVVINMGTYCTMVQYYDLKRSEMVRLGGIWLMALGSWRSAVDFWLLTVETWFASC
jgi:nucleoside-diphosphate-sugar epimerase